MEERTGPIPDGPDSPDSPSHGIGHRDTDPTSPDREPQPQVEPEVVPRRRRWLPRGVRATVALVVIFFVLEYLLLPEIASAGRSLDLLSKVNVAWLVTGVLLEVCALVAYAELTHTVLSPKAPSRFRLLRINMSSLAVTHVVPGGTAPGAAVAFRLLTESGVSGSTSAFGLATQAVGSAVVLNVIFWFVLLISIPLHGYNPLYGFAAIAGVLLMAAFGGTVLLLTRGTRQALDPLHGLVAHIPFINADRISALIQNIADRLGMLLRDRQLLTRALVWAAANWLLDAASLWVFILAFGRVISPVDLLVAYGLANILAVIPITPAGLGVIEGVLIPTLAGFGIPKAVAILAVLAWRLINFWLPIPLGGASYLSLRLGPFAKGIRALSGGPPPTHGAAG